jgi:hypothetical protein
MYLCSFSLARNTLPDPHTHDVKTSENDPFTVTVGALPKRPLPRGLPMSKSDSCHRVFVADVLISEDPTSVNPESAVVLETGIEVGAEASTSEKGVGLLPREPSSDEAASLLKVFISTFCDMDGANGLEVAVGSIRHRAESFQLFFNSLLKSVPDPPMQSGNTYVKR